jgi:hypothetical protein
MHTYIGHHPAAARLALPHRAAHHHRVRLHQAAHHLLPLPHPVRHRAAHHHLLLLQAVVAAAHPQGMQHTTVATVNMRSELAISHRTCAWQDSCGMVEGVVVYCAA